MSKELPQRLRQMADHTGLDAVAELLREAATELEHREDLSSLLLAENTSFADKIFHHEELLERAVLAEREACAQICDFEVAGLSAIDEKRPALAVGICAAAIRARGAAPQQEGETQ